MPEPLVPKYDVRRCPRCHADHGEIPYKQLTFPIEIIGGPTITHYALCPTSGQPLLLRITVETTTTVLELERPITRPATLPTT